MIDLSSLATHLQPGEGGIWFSPSRSEISHPDECQDWYLKVEDDSYWFRHRADCIVECLRRFPPGGPLLDVGGGNGHVSLAIKSAGFQPVLVEPSLTAVKNAQVRGLSPLVCSTLEDAGWREASVPAVASFDVMEHIEDDHGFLQSIGRLLTDEGRLYLTVPAYGFLWSSHDVTVGHFRRYTLGMLRQRMSAAGFQTEFASYLFSPLPLPIGLLRSLPFRLGLSPQGRERFAQEHSSGRGLLSRGLATLLGWERRRLQAGRRIPFGSSCLIVARKQSSSAVGTAIRGRAQPVSRKAA